MMDRTMGMVFLGIFVLTIALPDPGWGGAARVRALAGGDARLLPDDDGTIGVFPNRLSEHRRIFLHNVNPDGHRPNYFTETGRADFENAETWAEVSFDWLGGVTQIGVNRPTNSTFLQNSIVNPTTSPAVPPAGSLLDIGFARDGWGFLGNIGVSASEGDNTNWFLEGVYGMNMASGRELAFRGAFNHIVRDDFIDLGVDIRSDRGGGGFFDHWVGSAGYSHTESTDSFSFDGTLLHYNGDNRFGDTGLTHLVAVGATLAFVAVDGADNATVITVPTATAGAEYAVKSWLKLLGSVTRDFTFRFVSGGNSAIEGSTIATVGARGTWGSMGVEAVVNNGFFESGPDFIGGTAPGISSFVSVVYGLN